jgi:hypothetical protein
MKLLKSQKNELYDLIVRHELSPAQFYIKEINNIKRTVETRTIIRYNDSDFYFSFNTENTNQFISFSPGLEIFKDSQLFISWEGSKYFVSEWLAALTREINEPDKWELLEKEMKQISATFDDSTDKFSASEYEDLKQRMNQLKEGIKANDLLSEHFEILNAKIDHLTASALTMNKFDWKSQFVGTVINLSMYLAFSEEARTAFFGLIKLVMTPIILIH